MNNIEISVLNCENQLLACRKQLNDLIYEYDSQTSSNSLISYKIGCLQNEVDQIAHQLAMLRADLYEQPQAAGIQSQTAVQAAQEPFARQQNVQLGQEPFAQQQNVQAAQEPFARQQNVQAAQESFLQQQAAVRPDTVPPQNITQVRKRLDVMPAKSRDLENMIGRSWMGIFASILIFVSFILFATLLAPFITDAIKMTAMYLVSISFTLFGLIKLKKHHNKLYLAISSCGVGAVYLSLFLTNLYFKAIGDATLYLCLLVWAVFVCYLSRWRDRIFQIIGQSGITIALVFGIILCVDTKDSAKFFLLALFFAVTAAVFYASSYSREFHKNIVNNGFNAVNLFQMLIGYWMMDASGLTSKVKSSGGWSAYYLEMTGFVILLFFLLQFIVFLLSKLKENNIGFGLFMTGNVILTMLYILRVMDGAKDSLIGAVYLVMGFLLLAVIERKFADRKDDGKTVMQIFALPLFILSVFMISFFQDHISLSFVMLAFLLLGYYKNDAVYKYESLIMALVYCFVALKYPIEHLGLGLLFFAALAFFLYTKKEQYHIVYKLCVYFVGLLFVSVSLHRLLDGVDIKYDIIRTVIFTVAALLNVLAARSIFVKNFQTLETEKVCTQAVQITNALFMAYSLYAISDTDNAVCHFILVLIAVVIFLVNTKNLLERHQGMWPGIYIGIKLTVLIVTILSSYDTANYVISVSAFLFAIVSIIIGFKFVFKSFRIYGLVLSLISVAKLILVDISYENTLGHALSFFVCGILCFVISMIYHLIDKKVQER